MYTTIKMTQSNLFVQLIIYVIPMLVQLRLRSPQFFLGLIILASIIV